MTTVRLNEAAIRGLADEADIRRGLERVGDQVADRARVAAPKDTGAMAASIHAEAAEDGSVRVSFDSEHAYGIFSELGTSRMSARPFLRPALDGTYDL